METKKLILNKETLLRLQERQLQAILGADAMSMSNCTISEHSVEICCGISVNGNCSDGPIDEGPKGTQRNATCCQKSC